MRHNVSGRKFNRTKSHRDAMLANMASSLLEHKKLHTTEAKAKELRPFAEALITKAKHALAREKQNLLPEGQKIDIHNRREVYKTIRNKGVIQELFDAIAPVVESRNGGYCRIIKTGIRRGDAARTAIIELVDWSAPIDGVVSSKKKKKTASKKTVAKATTSTTKKIEENIETPITEELTNVEVAAPIEEVNETNLASEEISADTTPIEMATNIETAPVEEIKVVENDAPIEAKENSEEAK